MATSSKAKETAVVDEHEGKVPVRLPRISGEDTYVYVCVNNTGYSIKRGETTYVEPYIAEEIERSEAAREAFFKKSDAMKSKG